MELSSSQKALIPIFMEKWLNLAFSTKNIDSEVATEYYALMDKNFGLSLYERDKRFYRVYEYTTYDCCEKIKQNLNFQNYELAFISEKKLKTKLEDKFFYAIFTNTFYTRYCLYIDYCVEVLNRSCNVDLWNILKQLCANCGLLLIPFQSICFVCDRYKLPINLK